MSIPPARGTKQKRPGVPEGVREPGRQQGRKRQGQPQRYEECLNLLHIGAFLLDEGADALAQERSPSESMKFLSPNRIKQENSGLDK